jgi:hypothetical protein
MTAVLFALQAGCQRSEEPGQAIQDPATDSMQTEAYDPKAEALAQAQSDFDTAMRRCDMLAADQQASCREDAQNSYDAAKSAVEGPPGPS